MNYLRRFLITLLLASIIIVTQSSIVSGQGLFSSGTESYTVEPCGVSLSYPSGWTTDVKSGTLDTSAGGEFAVSNDGMPKFMLISCNEIDDMDLFRSLGLKDLGDMLQTYFTTTDDFDFTVVEDTHVVDNLIGGQDVAVFAGVADYKDNTIPKAAIESYITPYQEKTYLFSYFDSPEGFDKPESKETRDKILQSIKFVSS